jgi:hypothetical protein
MIENRRSLVSPDISLGFDAFIITQVSAWFFDRIETHLLLQTVLGEKFWPTARPQVKKARKRI